MFFQKRQVSRWAGFPPPCISRTAVTKVVKKSFVFMDFESSSSSFQKTINSSCLLSVQSSRYPHKLLRTSVITRNKQVFHLFWGVVNTSLNQKLENHPLSVVNYLLNMFTAILHVWRPASPTFVVWRPVMPWRQKIPYMAPKIACVSISVDMELKYHVLTTV